MSKTLVFHNGHSMPIVGLGTWKSSPGQVQAAVKCAISEAGYRHIDCAMAYGNEDEVGRGITECIQSGKVNREDVFVTSKCWNTFHKRESVKKACERSLKQLNLDYMDLYLIHWPYAYLDGDDLTPKDNNGQIIYADIDYLETWQGMEDCLNAGLVKSIGVSNFNSEQLQRVLDACNVKPVVNQVECHVYLNQEKLHEFCQARGVALTAYSPLGSADSSYRPPDVPSILEDPTVNEIATKYNKSPAQILLKFNIQRNIAVIPKSVTATRISSNIDIFDFDLTSEDIKELLNLNKNLRYLPASFVADHKQYPFHIPF